MPQLTTLRADELRAFHQRVRERYEGFARRGLKLNLTRGKPSSAQLDLCNELLEHARPARLHVGRDRLPQLRRAAGPAGAACAARADLRRDARPHHPRRQHQPRSHARRRRLFAAERHVRQRAAVVEGIAHRFHLRRARLRPALLHLQRVRHRDDHGAAARRRSGHGRSREAGRRGSADQGHVVRAEVQQSVRRGVLGGDDRAARAHADCGGAISACSGTTPTPCIT